MVKHVRSTARLVAAAAVSAGVLAGCGGDGDSVAAPRADRTAAGTAEASPSASAAPDSAVRSPRPTRLGRTDEFGVVARLSADMRTVAVDRVDMLGGAEAEKAAAARGAEVTNDYFLVNDNPRLRTYDVSPQAVVWGDIGFGHPAQPQRVSLEEWRDFVGTDRGRETLFHFEVRDGLVVGIEEQYLP